MAKAIAWARFSARAAWLKKMQGREDRKELADPTEADEREMLLALGDDPTFAKFSDENKASLFCVMLTIREKLKMYAAGVKFDEEQPGPAISALVDLTEAAGFDKRSAGREAWRKKIAIANTPGFPREIAQRIAAKPRASDQRAIRSQRQRHEAAMIGDCLNVFGTKGDDGLMLAVRIVLYTSGETIEPEAFQKRLARARALRRTIDG